jgi:hypothetical protein
MNASNFRNSGLRKSKFINASSREKTNSSKREQINQLPQSFKVATRNPPDTTNNFNNKLRNEPENITIKDVLYNDYSKPNNKKAIVLSFKDVPTEEKPNKHNHKILRKFLKQEAEKINKSDF